MFKTTLLAALAALSLIGSANAMALPSTYVVRLDPTDILNSHVTTMADALSNDIDVNSATVEGNAHVVTGSVDSQYLAPAGVTGEYLYIGSTPTAASSATFTLNSPHFGLTWGSIDTYNTLALTTLSGKTYTISGTTLLTLLNTSPVNILVPNGTGCDGCSNSGYQANVLFTAMDDRITQAVLTSSSAAFEVANISSVPLPGAALLFGSGIAALVAARKKARA